jgi:hypothetical protein
MICFVPYLFNFSYAQQSVQTLAKWFHSGCVNVVQVGLEDSNWGLIFIGVETFEKYLEEIFSQLI